MAATNFSPLRAHGKARTSGLADATILDFAARDPRLGEAIAAAAAEYARVRDEFQNCSTWTRTRRRWSAVGLRQLLRARRRQPLRRAGRAARGWSRSRARCCTTPAATACSASATPQKGDGGDGPAAGGGQHHDPEPVAAALHARAEAGNRLDPRRLPVRELHVPQFRFGIGVAGRAHRRCERQDHDRSGRATPARRSSAWW